MLDQLDLADLLAQECFACRTTVSYNKDGEEVQGRGWHFMENMKDTVWDFALVLRQKYQEDIFRRKLKDLGITLEAPKELVAVEVDDTLPLGGHRVEATVKDSTTGQSSTLKCRYLIGADGGRSFVRRAMGIPFDGSSSEDKWVRIDGIVETDMPKSRSYCAVESPTHGNVLWAALDHGATRIGFAFTAERQKAYPVFDEAAAVLEAIASVKPFTLDFKQVDWWTIYVVGQRVARNFFLKDCVFLAGDACHTHSSGAAQGMNTGLHDAVNLAWKLALVLRGDAHHDLLHSYEAERRPNVEKLINYDKDISRLMTMQLPLDWKGDPNADPNEVLGVVMAEAATFSSGLGIYYDSDDYLNVKGSFECGTELTSAAPGRRVADVKLQKPGTRERTRLHKETPNVGKFYIVIFAGNPESTGKQLSNLSGALEKSSLYQNKALPVSWLTISAKYGPSACEVLGIPAIGRIFYDEGNTAHQRYCVKPEEGAIFVLRPDGWVGTAARLDNGAVEELTAYFDRFSATSSKAIR